MGPHIVNLQAVTRSLWLFVHVPLHIPTHDEPPSFRNSGSSLPLGILAAMEGSEQPDFWKQSVFRARSSLKILIDARDWQEAHLSVKASSIVKMKTHTQGTDKNTTSCSLDAIWNSVSLDYGIGGIFTSQSNGTLSQGSTSCRFVSSWLVAEALALKAALIAASNSEIRELNVFSDSQSLIMLLNSGSVINELKIILFDILCLSRSFSSSIRFMFVLRLANESVDTLAKSTLRSLCIASV